MRADTPPLVAAKLTKCRAGCQSAPWSLQAPVSNSVLFTRLRRTAATLHHEAQGLLDPEVKDLKQARCRGQARRANLQKHLIQFNRKARSMVTVQQFLVNVVPLQPASERSKAWATVHAAALGAQMECLPGQALLAWEPQLL